jgi:uncharacterized protein
MRTPIEPAFGPAPTLGMPHVWPVASEPSRVRGARQIAADARAHLRGAAITSHPQPEHNAPTKKASVLSRRPLLSFVVLAAAFSWWPWPLYSAHLAPYPIVAVGPFVAALVVLGRTRGRAGVGQLLRSMVHWRVRPVIYVAALGLPILTQAIAAALNVALGAEVTASFDGVDVGFGLTFLVFLLIPGAGGTWEEPGWRGYALKNMQESRPGVLAIAGAGVLWAVWHLPLMVSGQEPWTEMANVAMMTFGYAWVFNSSGGSVLLVMLFHTMNNTMGSAGLGPMFEGADESRRSLLLAAIWAVVATLLMRRTARRVGDLPLHEASTAEPRSSSQPAISRVPSETIGIGMGMAPTR